MKDLYNIKVVQQLSAACKKRRNIWKHLGYELSLSRSDLNIIQIDHEASVESRCSAMLELWLERQYDASWEKLREALVAVELPHLAGIVSSWLLPTEMSSRCTVDANNGTYMYTEFKLSMLYLICVCVCVYVWYVCVLCVRVCVCGVHVCVCMHAHTCACMYGHV